jgi:hypothetical protein
MINVRVHFQNTDEFLDKDFFLLIKLPAIPRLGDRLFLSDDDMEHFENLVRSNEELADRYFCKEGCNRLWDLSYVQDVVFHSNEEYVSINLNDEYDADL